MKKLVLVLVVTLFVSVLLADPMDEINDWATKQTGNFDANDVVTFMNGRAEGDITYGSEYIFNSAETNFISVAVLDSAHFVVSYCDVGNSNYGTAVIGTVSGNTISYGSEYVFNSAATYGISVAVLDAAHFVVSYYDSGNSGYGTAVVGTVSGNTISYGSEYVFNSAITDYISVAVLDAAHFVVSYSDGGNSNYGTAIVGEIEGPPDPPIINSITDIQNDQGHQVQLIWTRASVDLVYSQNNFYTVWRLDEQPERETGSIIVEDISDILLYTQNRENTKLYWQRDDEIWTYIATIPSLLFEQYSLTAPTLIDSSASSTPEEYNSTFMVAFHGEYNYYLSPVASGYSVDNIAPDETEVYISQNGSNMNLNWNEVEYGTFQGNSYPEINGIWYKIYAGDSPYFVCDEVHLIDTVTDLNYNYPIAGEEKKFFKIVVSDQP